MKKQQTSLITSCISTILLMLFINNAFAIAGHTVTLTNQTAINMTVLFNGNPKHTICMYYNLGFNAKLNGEKSLTNVFGHPNKILAPGESVTYYEEFRDSSIGHEGDGPDDKLCFGFYKGYTLMVNPTSAPYLRNYGIFVPAPLSESERSSSFSAGRLADDSDVAGGDYFRVLFNVKKMVTDDKIYFTRSGNHIEIHHKSSTLK